MSKRMLNKVDFHNLGSDDLLSRLPDEILVSILSSLPLKDAVVTSLLSRRWVYLWCQTDRLIFVDMKRSSLIQNGSDLCFLNEERNKYIKWVNHVICRHKSPTIGEFKICFNLDKDAREAISKWIKFAISKNVQTLELDLLRSFTSRRNYCFPLKRQSSNGMGMVIKSLKVLILNGVNVNDEGLKKILNNCPVLDHLSIKHSRKLVKAEIHGKGLALKKLDIILCYKLESVEICDSNIVALSCFGTPISLKLDNVQKLENICISISYSWKKINDIFCQISCRRKPYLRVLQLHLYCVKVSKELLPFRKLQNVKQLMVIIIERSDNVLYLCSSLVEACPNLQRFTIARWCIKPGKTREVREMAKKPHQRLEVVEIGEYYGRTSDLELAMYFIQNCVALKKLVIKPKKEEENGGRYNAQQQLEPRIPNGVELVIL